MQGCSFIELSQVRTIQNGVLHQRFSFYNFRYSYCIGFIQVNNYHNYYIFLFHTLDFNQYKLISYSISFIFLYYFILNKLQKKQLQQSFFKKQIISQIFNGNIIENIKNIFKGECRQVMMEKLIQIRSVEQNHVGHSIDLKGMNTNYIIINKIIYQQFNQYYFLTLSTQYKVISCFYQDLSQQTSISILYYSMRLFMKNHQIQLNYEKKKCPEFTVLIVARLQLCLIRYNLINSKSNKTYDNQSTDSYQIGAKSHLLNILSKIIIFLFIIDQNFLINKNYHTILEPYLKLVNSTFQLTLRLTLIFQGELQFDDSLLIQLL
ncbi:hypothetical protein pb186bvf_014261 [Paramecium bursaria]